MSEKPLPEPLTEPRDRVEQANHRALVGSEERQARIARAYLRGEPADQIGEREGVSRATVYRDIQRAREVWKEQTAREYADQLAEKIAQLRQVQWEAWLAWEKSKRPDLAVSRTEGESHGEKGGAFESETRQKKRTSGTVGYLTQIRNALKLEAELLGLLDKNREGSADEDAPKPMEIVVGSREEAEHILSFKKFEEFRQAAGVAG